MKLSKLLYSDKKWAQHCLGRTKDGIPVNSLDVIHRDGREFDPSRDLEAFSLYGAIIHLYGGDGQSEVFAKLGDAIRKYSGRKVYLAQWNDEATTTFSDVKAVLEIANL